MKERGWPDDCMKCDLYDREKGCMMRAIDTGKPICENMTRKLYEYLRAEE